MVPILTDVGVSLYQTTGSILPGTKNQRSDPATKVTYQNTVTQWHIIILLEGKTTVLLVYLLYSYKRWDMGPGWICETLIDYPRKPSAQSSRRQGTNCVAD